MLFGFYVVGFGGFGFIWGLSVRSSGLRVLRFGNFVFGAWIFGVLSWGGWGVGGLRIGGSMFKVWEVWS